MTHHTFEELMKQKLAKAMEGEVVTFPGTYVKREYVTINGVKMLKDVWDYMRFKKENMSMDMIKMLIQSQRS